MAPGQNGLRGTGVPPRAPEHAPVPARAITRLLAAAALYVRGCWGKKNCVVQVIATQWDMEPWYEMLACFF